MSLHELDHDVNCFIHNIEFAQPVEKRRRTRQWNILKMAFSKQAGQHGYLQGKITYDAADGWDLPIPRLHGLSRISTVLLLQEPIESYYQSGYLQARKVPSYPL
jgi:hypothetical protein